VQIGEAGTADDGGPVRKREDVRRRDDEPVAQKSQDVVGVLQRAVQQQYALDQGQEQRRPHEHLLGSRRSSKDGSKD